MGIIASYWLEEPRGGVGDEREQMTSFLADLAREGFVPVG